MLQRKNGIQWLFVDFNSYFASVEQQENPALRDRPIIVMPADTEYTCAIAASYEAKAYGIKTGTLVKDARTMCPDLICVMAQHDKYVAYHNRILSEIVKHTPINKVHSIDELSSRLPPNKCNIAAALNVAQNLKNGIWSSIGESINCSIGFAPNSFLAKIACEMQKPDGITILRQEDLQDRLFDLSLTDLPGIGYNMEKRLNTAGIRSVEDLWNTSPKHARKIWNSVQGERFWYLLHGYDIPMPATKPSLIGHSRVLDPALRTPANARRVVRKMTTKAVQRLCGKDLMAHRIRLSCTMLSGQKYATEAQTPATQNIFEILHHIDTMWDTFIEDLSQSYNTHHNVRVFKKVSVTLHDLRPPHDVNHDLFATTGQIDYDKHRQQKTLADALTSLREKYKKDVVSIGTAPQTSSGYVGTKIAFARVPDEQEFWE